MQRTVPVLVKSGETLFAAKVEHLRRQTAHSCTSARVPNSLENFYHNVGPLTFIRALAVSRPIDNEITLSSLRQCSLQISLTRAIHYTTTAQKRNQTHALSFTLTLTIATTLALTHLLPKTILHALPHPLDLTTPTQRQNRNREADQKRPLNPPARDLQYLRHDRRR